MKNPVRCLVASVIVVLSHVGASPAYADAESPPELLVFAAASLTSVLDELSQD